MFKIKHKSTIFYLVIIIGFIIYVYIDKQNTPIECSSSFSIRSGDERILLSITFYAKNKVGLITLTGSTENSSEDISIKKNFTYETKGQNIYILKNSESDIRLTSENNKDVMNRMLPSFIIDNEASNSLIIKIIRIKKEAWVFMSSNTPYFVCERAGVPHLE